MKKIWDKYFYWNKTERRGVVPLLLLIFVLIAANLFYRYRTLESPKPDENFIARAKEFYEQKEQKTEYADSSQSYRKGGNFTYSSNKKSKFKTPTSTFDPNELSKQEWAYLGLSEKQVESIIRFTGRGGKFYQKEDLKNVYVISDEFYEHIEPYIVISSTTKYESGKKNSEDKPVAVKVDINKADSAQLVSLKGITPKMVKKILDVRKTFGGFHSLEQVKDLYGFYESNYAKISEMAYVSDVQIQPININYCEFKDLLNVPGLNYETVKNIINHRQSKGSFKKTEDLVTLNLAEPDLYAKIAPYLTVK